MTILWEREREKKKKQQKNKNKKNMEFGQTSMKHTRESVNLYSDGVL